MAATSLFLTAAPAAAFEPVATNHLSGEFNPRSQAVGRSQEGDSPYLEFGHLTSSRYVTVHASNLVGQPAITLDFIYAGVTRSVSLANDQTVTLDYDNVAMVDSDVLIGLDPRVQATDVTLDISAV
jgi:hypothetical protein